MSEIDWSKVPVDATHFKEGDVCGQGWRKMSSSNEWQGLCDGKWVGLVGATPEKYISRPSNVEALETIKDPINNPAHYQSLPGFESIDVIQAALTPDEFQGFCKGNMLKYRFRAGKKGPAETCLAKADWYEARAKSALGE